MVGVDTPLFAEFGRRQRHEDGYAKVTAIGTPEPARFAAVVLYSRAALCENDGTRSTDADWEVVSLITSPVQRLTRDDAPPMNPLTIARNVLAKPGGTPMPADGELARTLAHAVLFHARRAAAASEEYLALRPSPSQASPPTSAPTPNPVATVLEPSPSAPALTLDAELGPLPYLGHPRAVLECIQAHWSSVVFGGDESSPDWGRRATVRLPPDGFVCDSVMIGEETALHARFRPEGFIEITAEGASEPARSVVVNLVSNGEAWRVLAIRTSPVDGPEPELPLTMAAAYLGRAAQLTREEALALAESVYHHALRAKRHRP
jgi:hypothetical protein